MEISWADRLHLFQYALQAALCAGLVCPLLGAFLYLRRTSFYGVTLPQFATAGVVFGFLVLPWWIAHVGLGGLTVDAALSNSHAAMNYHVIWAALFTFGGLLWLDLLARRSGPDVGRVAAGFAIASAATILFSRLTPVGASFVDELLQGEVLGVGVHEFETIAALLGLVALSFWVFYRDLAFVSYDREMAQDLARRGHLQLNDEIERLVLQLRERMGRIDRQRRQHRTHLRPVKRLQPFHISRPELRIVQEPDAVLDQGRPEVVPPAFILLLHHPPHPPRDGPECLRGRQPIHAPLHDLALHLLLDPGHPDLKELVKVRTDDAEKLDPFQERDGRIQRLIQDTLVELQPAQFPIEKARGGQGGGLVGLFRWRRWRGWFQNVRRPVYPTPGWTKVTNW